MPPRKRRPWPKAPVGSSGYRWWGRYRAAGGASLRDRPCTPHRQPRRLSREAETEIIAVRERSGGGPEVVGAIVDRPASTVGKVLRRLGRSRLPKPPRPPVVRLRARASGGDCCTSTPRSSAASGTWASASCVTVCSRSPRAGWQHVHVARRRSHPSSAYAEVLLSDRRADALAFLERALLRWFAAQGITVEEVMTDNGSAYRSRRLASALRAAWAAPPAYPALHAAHQRQGRALHPNLAA